MRTKRGIKVSPGIAITTAHVLDAKDRPIPRRLVAPERVPAELERLEQALAATRSDIQQQQEESHFRFGANSD